MAELRRVPLGRLEVLAQPGRDVAAELADVRRAAQNPAAVDALAAALRAWLAAPADDARRAAAQAALTAVRRAGR
jgi:hypothetical protein